MRDMQEARCPSEGALCPVDLLALTYHSIQEELESTLVLHQADRPLSKLDQQDWVV